jgi:transcriptional regulator of acetoin/glycerol metabolism
VVTGKYDRVQDETLTDTAASGRAVRPVFTAPHLFVVFECSRPEAAGSRHSLANIDCVRIGRGPTRNAERVVEGDLRTLALSLPDPRMSSEHGRLAYNGAGFVVEDLGSRNGTRLNGSYVAARTALSDGDVIECGHVVLRYRAALSVPTMVADFDCLGDETGLMRTMEPTFAHNLAQLARVARSNSPVLLLGETGVGKEVLARAIHEHSGRTGPLVAVNCGALPLPLLEAQLFGHVRGAFSGAVSDALGLLRSADGGTLLLDEVGDLPSASQVALLRVLQEQEVVPVGGVRPIKVDLRVIAATHRSLDQLIAAGDFRSDLYARLAGFSFTIPPLRARREDLGLMVAAFARQRRIRLTPAAGRALLCYDWPLNVREVKQALEVAAALADDQAIDVKHLPASARSPAAASPEGAPVDPVRERLIALLTRHRGNVSNVAKDLGKARMQVQRWMKRYGLDPRSFK